ncbi:hypothetical protein RISK_000919 [Rhodopirellula islandica]|uniref:Uncharacterized protein n=1 Tax=Rhodopirellula islandica TaxID=595434 RepID=A0A0J1BL05_RHOIS|nr:hypothetical protein RISK_000919 [Rhodopirellula islandica]
MEEPADESGSLTESVGVSALEGAFSSVGLPGVVIVESFLLIQFEGWFTSGATPKNMPKSACWRRTE